MLELDLDLKDEIWEDITAVSGNDIAIIGMDVRFPQAADAKEFWEQLRIGANCIGDFPDVRKKDVEAYLRYRTPGQTGFRYAEGGYLERIDAFDHSFFKISKKEADLMDPHQRVFLETAWRAIEDAGYGGKQLAGSSTGVYVGFTPRGEYRKYIAEVEPSSSTVAEAGNLSSIVASRIAYILDLRGPSMIVNTECSSSLVAVHLACRSLRSGECNMAIAGGVRLSLSPIVTDEKLGIESEQGKVCTFDDDSDGAVFGEGSAALILKPLHAAQRDQDHIYAIIKGSAVNQDGASVGITAPNVLAQEDVIVSAWEDAGIDPESISYVEAHGTGTRLGDPVEMDALSRAFARYTDRKQFCGVGSVKTNIGHLDNVAGIASLVKLILAMQHKELPSSLHFGTPNRNIPFEDTGMYVVNRLQAWKAENGARRAGVSSFGLSGTNCHLILEEPSSGHELRDVHGTAHAPGIYLFTLSAASKQSLVRLIGATHNRIASSPELDLSSICHTLHIGRGHYAYRLAIVVKTREQLLEALKSVENLSGQEQQLEQLGIMWARHQIIADHKPVPAEGEIYSAQRQELSLLASHCLEAIMNEQRVPSPSSVSLEGLWLELGRLYVQGAEVEWDELYYYSSDRKVSLPSYVFEPVRCWLNVPDRLTQAELPPTSQPCGHPLLDQLLVQTPDHDVYWSRFSVEQHWVLNEHCLADAFIMPGTAYLEMARACARRYMDSDFLEFRDVHFIQSLVVPIGETKDVQTMITRHRNHLQFVIASQTTTAAENQWTVYCEGTMLTSGSLPQPSRVDLQSITEQCTRHVDLSVTADQAEQAQDFQFGPRWSKVTRSIQAGKEEVLAMLELPDEYYSDLKDYELHPSLLDMAVNAITQSTGNGMYLPLSYKSFSIYSRLPGKLYSHVKRTHSSANLEVVSYDVLLVDEAANIIAKVEQLTTKKVHRRQQQASPTSGPSWRLASPEPEFYRICYAPATQLAIKAQERLARQASPVLVMSDGSELARSMISQLMHAGSKVIEVRSGDGFACEMQDRYTVGRTQEDYDRLVNELGASRLGRIVHCLTAGTSNKELNARLEDGVYSVFHLVKAIAAMRLVHPVDVTLFTRHARSVTSDASEIHPAHAAMVGLCQVVNQEFSTIKTRAVDVDGTFTAEQALSELLQPDSPFYIAYRNGIRYVEQLEEVNLPSASGAEACIREQGVYIITGGTGGLGLEIARELSRIKPVKLALLSRSGQIEGTERQQILHSIRQAGSAVHIYAVDVSDCTAMERILSSIHNELGAINGIVHCAGVAGNGYLLPKIRKAFEAVLLPKIQGTDVLDRVTAGERLDFWIQFSSISSVYGYPGQSDYVAANAYLDAFAAYHSHKGFNTVSVNWAPWKETGMAVDHKLKDDGIFHMLPTEEALGIFRRVLAGTRNDLSSGSPSQVIAGRLNITILKETERTGSMPFRLSHSIEQKLEYESRKVNVPASIKTTNGESTYGNVAAGNQVTTSLHNPSTANSLPTSGRGSNHDYSSIELHLSRAWAEVLGMADVDIYANFMDQGGDSILAVELLKRIEPEFPDQISISDIFSYPSVSELAAFLMQKTENAVHPGGDTIESQTIELQTTGSQAAESLPVNDASAAVEEEALMRILAVLEQLEKGDISVAEAEQILT
ncbi:type I polyketide synthase [Paenibacillus massiliensis]|uniref:type I polyketide synthase n=1 Tax=Paenibacillus massiliensis TaxID=225917 RepID=UPI00046FDA9B|nr:type I polyketide synthase [Paenibacillus massiliensis]